MLPSKGKRGIYEKIICFIYFFVATSVFAIEKCPDGGELKNGVCCKNGKALGGDLRQYSFIRPACGCPDGGKPGVSGHMCCKDGKAYNRETQKYDEVTPYCGCPNGGESVLSAAGLPECCKNNRAWNDLTKKYENLYPSLCGCPDGGKTGNSNSYWCCKNNYQYDEKTQAYDRFSPHECGCPDGGKLKPDSNYGASVCCKNNHAYNKKTKTYDQLSIDACGCPDGSELREGEWGKKWCCKNGLAQTDFEGPLIEVKACGCPDGGQVWEKRFCQKNGYIWNDNSKKYDMPNPILGCPKGSEEKNGVCCKNGYAFNAYTSKFESVNAFCGCQQGSSQSEWGKKYENIMKTELPKVKISDSEKAELNKHTERMVMQFNSFCCKDGKSYNDQTGKFDVDIPLCKPFPKDPKDTMEILWELCRHGVLMCM